MELHTGETLADRIGRGPVRIGEALQISLGVLSALEALHSHGIIHLKPSNVFLVQHGVKLLDIYGTTLVQSGTLEEKKTQNDVQLALGFGVPLNK